MTLDQDFLPVDYFTLTQKRHEWAVTADVVARGRAGAAYRWLAGYSVSAGAAIWLPRHVS